MQSLLELMGVAHEQISQAVSLTALDQVRVQYLGKTGLLTEQLKQLGKLPHEERKAAGAEINTAKQALTLALDERKQSLQVEALNARLQAEKVDVTLPGRRMDTGSLHPVTQTIQRISEIFAQLGFSLAEGPEIEDDFHNFTALNIPESHPARAMHDTFYMDSGLLLRTHTSSVQTRVMEKTQPPIRIICPGRVYRNEAISYRTHCFFHQVEALYIDKDVSFADLKQALLFFAKETFGTKTNIRLRPSYFPFTEPSAEMDISCNLCGGKGCPFCKYSGWVEILGCGMVDPNVLDNCGIDSKIYSGYALGMGIERITNLKYRIKDLRMFSENDVRFLEQFQSAY